MAYRITMIGAGSVGFSLAIARELVASKRLQDATFVLMDIDAERLAESETRIRELAAEVPLTVTATTDRRRALEGADFIVTSYAPQRMAFWEQDIELAARHGVHLLQGENGGPAGQIHALRNITIMMDIVRDVESCCPSAWLMNFTNPMSMLCTYLHNHTRIAALGFCHQVHGSFGVVAEMLGFEPGELQVISAGINHMSFLLDIRRRDSAESYMEPFLQKVRENSHWRANRPDIPEQVFTLEFLEAFGVYPVGYDNHISEYMPFFYAPELWEPLGYRSSLHNLRKLKAAQGRRSATGTIDDVEVERILGHDTFPFPKEPAAPYYRETPVAVMEALLSATPLYLDAMVLRNRGCISNLPETAVVDIPAVVVGGRARGIAVGELPAFPAELCRRQIAVHDLVVEAALTGDRRRFLEALCLDPLVPDLRRAKALMEDCLNAYREYLPQFY